MPVTLNGKLDRKALPPTDFSRSISTYREPRNDLKKTLCGIWQELLGVDRIGIGDNFFTPGGNSIAAIRAAHAMIRKAKASITVAMVFEHKTIAALCEQIITVEEGTREEWEILL